MRKYTVDYDRDSRSFTDACAKVSILIKESFTIEFEDAVGGRWVNVWLRSHSTEGGEYVIEIEFETEDAFSTETFKGPNVDYEEVIQTFLDRVTYWCDTTGMYNG